MDSLVAARRRKGELGPGVRSLKGDIRPHPLLQKRYCNPALRHSQSFEGEKTGNLRIGSKAFIDHEINVLHNHLL